MDRAGRMLLCAVVLAVLAAPGGTAHIRHLMRKSRIVGGENTAAGRFTYMCSLKNNDRRHICGAVLIDAKWALTAAHCVHPEIPNAVTFNALLAVGAHKITDDDSTPGVELIKVAKIYRHEKYRVNQEVKGSDIALLELATPSSLTPIPLPNSDHFPSERVLALGWGTDSTILQQLFLDVNSEKECKSFYADLGPHILCARNDDGDTCQGDSGGPILIPDSPDRSVNAGKSKYDSLIGLTSFGNSDCAAFTKPAGYTFVTPYLGWVAGIMRGSASSSPASPTTSIQLATKQWNSKAVLFKCLAGGNKICLCVLLHPQWVVTAAHCVAEGDSVEVGSLSPSVEKITGTAFIHPGYSESGGNDVALVKLSTRLGSIVTPQLPGSISQSVQGEELTTLMYDWKEKKIHTVRVEYFENDVCHPSLRDTAICAGAFNSLLCLPGTSGAPLLHKQDDDPPMLMGLLLSGPTCTTASATIPITYQDFFPVVQWINKTIANN